MIGEHESTARMGKACCWVTRADWCSPPTSRRTKQIGRRRFLWPLLKPSDAPTITDSHPHASVSGRRPASTSTHLFDTGAVTSSEYRNTVQPDTVPSGSPGGAIPVIARLVCADGLEEWWPARAVRWTATDVLIGFEAEPGNPRSLSPGSFALSPRQTDNRCVR